MDQDIFRTVISRFATGVTVITTRDTEKWYAMTANSLTSVSLVPPLVLVAVDLKAHTLAGLKSSGQFAVSILSEEHRAISRRYASPHQPPDPFAQLPIFYAPSGLPVLTEALAYLDCQIEAFYPGGDHQIVVARVADLQVLAPDKHPLIFYSSQYHRLAP